MGFDAFSWSMLEAESSLNFNSGLHRHRNVWPYKLNLQSPAPLWEPPHNYFRWLRTKPRKKILLMSRASSPPSIALLNLYGKTLTTAAASRSPPFVSKLMLSNVAMFEGTKNEVLLERNILSVWNHKFVVGIAPHRRKHRQHCASRGCSLNLDFINLCKKCAAHLPLSFPASS